MKESKEGYTTPKIVKYTGISPVHHRQQNSQQSIRASELKEGTSNQSVSPTVSFGGNGSHVRKISNQTKVLKLENGDVYEGQLSSRGEFQGHGRYVYAGKDMEYEGGFFRGVQHGRGKLFKLGSGESSRVKRLVYEGEWKNGQRQGQGKYYYESDNHYYSGEWYQNMRQGKGTYTSPHGQYMGPWKSGKAHGENGILSLTNGTTFHGQFAENNFIRGTITYTNGDEYKGELLDGLRHDRKGKYTYRPKKGSTKTYVGGWQNDKKNDQKGSIDYESGHTYTGTFQNGRIIEKRGCTWQWPDGSEYNGWFTSKNDNFRRPYVLEGVLKQRDGRQYEVNYEA